MRYHLKPSLTNVQALLDLRNAPLKGVSNLFETKEGTNLTSQINLRCHLKPSLTNVQALLNFRWFTLNGVSNLFETKEGTHYISQINLRYHLKSGSTKIPFFNFRWRLLKGISNLFETKPIENFIEIINATPYAMLNALRSPLYFSFTSLQKKVGGKSYANKAIELIKVIINIFIIVPDIILYFILKKIYFSKTVLHNLKKDKLVFWSEIDPPFLIPPTCQVSKTW